MKSLHSIINNNGQAATSPQKPNLGLKKLSLPVLGLFLLGIMPLKAQYNVVYNFNPSSGALANNATGDVTLSGGVFYGMTFGGGTNYEGNIFSVHQDGSSPTNLYSFPGGATGAGFPQGNLTLVGSTLYGLVPDNNQTSGQVFTSGLTPNTYTDLYDFDIMGTDINGDTPAQPTGSLTYVSSSGLFYGMTLYGGVNETGNIFSIDQSGNYTDLYDFGTDYSGYDGELPYAKVTISGGVLYGMTLSGGAFGSGMIFSYNLSHTGGLSGNNDGYSDLYDFGAAGSTDGSAPFGSLTLAGNTLYGMTDNGGTNGSGVIFSISPGGGYANGYTILYNFGNVPNDGENPNGSLTATVTGDTLYGMTSAGGSAGFGNMFGYVISTTSYEPVFSFTGNSGSYSGSYPVGDLVLGPSGDTVYGMTEQGGSNGYGVIFSYLIKHTCNLSVTTSSIGAMCFGVGSTGSATATPVNGTGPYTYAWNSFNGVVLSRSNQTGPIPAGTFTVTVTDAYGCTATASATITQPNPLNFSTSTVRETSCSASPDGSVAATVFGGVPPYTYSWSNNNTSVYNSGLSAGTYSITVTDANGCTHSGTAVVTQSPALSITTSATPGCIGDANGTASVSASGGFSPYYYSWSDNNNQATATATGLSAGTYSVMVNDVYNCTLNASVIVTELASAMSVSVSSSSVSCNGVSDGNITATANNGIAPYTYSWSNNATTSSVSGLSAGTYTITAIDNNGCSASASATITQPAFPLAVSLTSMTNIICNGGTGNATVQVNPPVTKTFKFESAVQHLTIPANAISTATISVSGGGGGNDNGNSNGGSGASFSGLCTIIPGDVLGVAVGGAGGTQGGNYDAGGGGGGTFVYDSNVVLHAPSGTTGLMAVAGGGGGGGELNGGLNAGTNLLTNAASNGNSGGGAAGSGGNGGSASTAGGGGGWLTNGGGVTGSSQANGGEDESNHFAGGNRANYGSNGAFGGGGSSGSEGASGGGGGGYNGGGGGSGSNYSGGGGGGSFLAGGTANLVGSVTATNSGNGSASITYMMPVMGTPPYTYSWSPAGGTNPSASGLAAGTYTCTATDNNGCTATIAVTITQPLALTATMGTPINDTKACANTGSGAVTASGGTSPYTYSWSNGQTKSTATGLSGGTYTVTVKDKNGCISAASVSITQPSIVTAIMGTPVNSSACANTGSATVTAGGGTLPFTYSWSDAIHQTTATASNLSGGSYTVTVKDANSCTASASVSITKLSAVTAIMGTSTNCTSACSNTGSATVTAGSGSSPYTYSWNDNSNQTTPTANNLSGGSYTVTVEDANGCTASASVAITQPSAITAIMGTPTNCTSACSNTGSAIVTAGGGTSPYTYLWNDGNSQTTPTATGLSGGIYTVTVSDVNSCSAMTSVTITQSNAVSVSITQSTGTCYGETNGGATAGANGGNLPYTYSWSGGLGSSSSVSGLPVGTYTVTLTDANNCSTSTTVAITPPGMAAGTISTFAGIDGVFGYSGDGGTATAAELVTPTGMRFDGTGNLYIADYYGNVIRKVSPAGSITTVAGNSAYGYSGDGGQATAAELSRPIDVVTDASGNVYIDDEVNSVIREVNTGGVITTIAGIPQAPGYSGDGGAGTVAELKFPTGIALDGLGNLYISDNENNVVRKYVISSGIITTVAGNGIAGYSGDGGSATVAEFNGPSGLAFDASGNLDITDINNNVIRKVNISTGNISTIAGNGYGAGANNGGYSGDGGPATAAEFFGPNEINFDASGNLYVADILNSRIRKINTSGIISTVAGDGTQGYNGDGIAATSAELYYPYGVALDASGNIYIGDFNNNVVRKVNAVSTSICIPTATANVTSNVICDGGTNGSATVTASGGVSPYTYSWSDLNNQTTYTATGLSAGTYTVTLEDNNSSTVTVTVTITQPTAVTASVIINLNATACANTGSASVTAGGGNSPYTYSWNDNSNQTTTTASNLSGGSYTVTVTDNNGCTATASVNISQPSPVTATMGTPVNSSPCANTGSASVTAGGGNSPYTYSWDDNSNQTTARASNLSGGGYTITVTDNNGCSATASVTISQPLPLTATMGTPVGSSPCANTGSAMVTAGGGNSPYTYSWNDNSSQATATATNLSADSYTVTVTDNNGCTATTSVAIIQLPSPTISYTAVPPLCNGGNGSITANIVGGFAPYIAEWYLPGGTTIRTVSYTPNSTTTINKPAGTYTLAIFGTANCNVTETITLTQPPVVSASTSVINVSCNGANTGSATAIPIGGRSPFNYFWSDPNNQTTASATGLSAGLYEVEVGDSCGHSVRVYATITEPAAVTATMGTPVNSIACNNTGSASVIAGGGTSPYTYLWTDGASQTNATATGLSGGTYIVTVSDMNNCFATASVTITQPSTVGITIFSVANASCGGTGSVTANTATGGNPPYTYSWSNGGGINVNAILTAGTYTITVTDNDGCTDMAYATITQSAAMSATAVVTANVSCNGATTGSALVTPSGSTSPYTYSWSPTGGSNATASGLSAGTYTVYVSGNGGCNATVSVTITQPSQIVAGQQKLIGLTYAGGTNGAGTIFGYSLDSNRESVPWNLTNGTDGGNSYDRLILDPNNGLYYATTSVGGTNNGGTIIKFNPATNAETVVWNFGSGTDGTNAQGSLIYYAPTGLFYGMTSNSANENGPGIIYSFNPVTNTESVLWNFGTGSDGANPYGTLVLDPMNNILYGVTDNGGSNGVGAIISFNPSTGTESVVYSFGSLPDGQNPYSSMVFNPTDNNFYGLTTRGGAYTGWDGSDGVIFKFNPATNTESVVWNFGNGSDAMQPNGTLVYNPANNLYYGMATFGGNNNDGAIFSFDPSANAESVVWNFQGGPGDGNNPFGDLTYNAANGLFYGVVPYGGQYNYSGILFNFNPSTNNESVLWNFGNGSDGAYSFGVGGITILNAPGSGAVALQNVSCKGGSNGSAQAFFTGGTGSYSYKWSNGTSSIVSTSNPTGNVLSAGTYTVTVTDGNGCTATASVAITQPLLLGVRISSVTNATCGGTGSITANAAMGGTSPYTYSWSNGGGTNLNTTFNSGTYTITATDNNGCTATASATISQSVMSAGATVTNNVSCNGASTASASVTSSGGTSPYTYSWSPRGGSNASATGLSAGTYTIHVSGKGGCTATTSVTITQPSAMSITTSITANETCNGAATGKATATASGGTSPYTYSWSPTGGSSATASGLSAGTYTVHVTSNGGCIATANLTITQPAAVNPVTTSSNGINFCSSLNTTLGTQYTGNDALQFNGSTTYCTVADAADMDFGTSTNFTVEGWINFTASEANYTGLIAKGQTSTGIWTGWQLVLYGNKIASEIQSPLGYVGPGSSELIGTTALNDGNWHHVAFTVNRSARTATLYVDGAQQSTFTSSYIGGTVTYNGNALMGVDRQSRLHFNGKMDEFRIWNVAMTQAQIQASMNTAVQKNSAGLVAYYRMDNGSGTTATDLTGNGNNATLVNSPSWAASTAPVGLYAGYSWSNSATGSATTVSSAGTYTVSVTDVNGCTGTGNVSLSLSIVTANVTTTNITCNGSNNGIAHSAPSGGISPYTYSWSPTGGISASATGLSAGTYTLHVTSNSGCTDTASVTITQPAVMGVSTTLTGVSCHGGNNGKAIANASGGTSPYTYSWSPGGGSNAIASGLSAGTYTVHLTSNNGCTATANAIITQPATVFTISAAITTNVTCNGGSTGKAMVSASGGTSPYTYSWSPNGGSGATASGLSAGTYTVQVSSNSGCTLTASVTITQPVATSVSTTSTGVICNGGSTGKATVSASGGVSPYTYSWSPNGGSGTTTSGLSAGTYTVHVTSHAGCSTTATVIITQPIAMSETQFIINCSNGKVTTAVLNMTGGVSPYTFSWSGGGGTKDTAVGLAAGTYTVKVTDHNGCSVTLKEKVSCGNAHISAGGNDSSATQCCQDLQNVTLYPNPNNGQFSVAGISKGMFIEIYDYTGRKISEAEANNETMQLNIANQSNGIYLIRIIDKDGNLVSEKKVVKVQ